MRLIKVQRQSDRKVQWAKNRGELKSITGLSSPTITNILRDVNRGRIYASREYVIMEAEVEVREVTNGI